VLYSDGGRRDISLGLLAEAEQALASGKSLGADGAGEVESVTVHEFTIVLDPDEDGDGYTVTVPALPGCITQGRTVDEALEMARDAITLYIGVLRERGDPIPSDVRTATVRVAA
jgi:predicted RNase H-like HicB family nuclease